MFRGLNIVQEEGCNDDIISSTLCGTMLESTGKEKVDNDRDKYCKNAANPL